MSVVYVIQARTNSTRLPAKVLLPLGGYPIVVLAAKRAGNIGEKVVVITSIESSDDFLCSILEQHQVPFFRGSLNNTLKRFVLALNSYDDDTIVVRLTADNIVPDGAFINEMVIEFQEKSMNYLCSAHVNSGLPYGLSAEVMRLSSLRDAFNNTTSEFDYEHVTPYIRRKYGDSIFLKYRALNMENCRCTIDVLEDYLLMASIFQNIENVIDESALDIISKLKRTD